ncbi:hypothetical protein SAMN05192565_12717 [Methylobacterium gossipiicola]|uniref:Uncharacterized protein n=2 Tax=Methylobacterium gossipiicola TaxID=582675 RepID=A0A1I2WT39_9HYPH|nr:hypothetical protein SAMN05192565_12717 [Methylobacterium gossipiicola]
MFYDSVHRLRLWLWRRQERMLERTHRLRRAEDASTLPSASGTAGYAAGADAGFHAGMFAGYENTNININSATCLDSGSLGGGGD